jgi:hypothetical protein
MRNTKRRRWIGVGLLLCTFALTSCAGGGGSTGTGITTAQGNISGAQTALLDAPRRAGSWLAKALSFIRPLRAVEAASGVENVTVRVAGTNLSSVSDANGAFSLKGDFGGPITLTFERQGSGRLVRLAIDIPTGGTLTLNDVELDERSGEASAAARNLDFDGVVTASNCPTGTIDMVSEVTPDDGNHYPVNVQSATLRDSTGQPIQCGDLASGDVLSVQGQVRDDGSVDCREADRRRRD